MKHAQEQAAEAFYVRPYFREEVPQADPAAVIAALDEASAKLNPVSGLYSAQGRDISIIMGQISQLRSAIALAQRAATP